MSINSGLFSSRSDEWATPKEFYATLFSEFKFTLDPCSTHENAVCSKHFTKKDNGLSQSWRNETVFMNPPYGKEISEWVKKAYQEAEFNGVKVVCLLPARTDTRWFHSFIYERAEIRFIKGRLKFGDGKQPAPFPSMLVIFNKNN